MILIQTLHFDDFVITNSVEKRIRQFGDIINYIYCDSCHDKRNRLSGTGTGTLIFARFDIDLSNENNGFLQKMHHAVRKFERVWRILPYFSNVDNIILLS